MTKRIHRSLAIATLILGAAAAMTACGTDAADTAQPGPVTQTTQATESATESATTPAVPPASGATGTQPPATTVPTQPPANATRTDDGCPAAEGDLLKIISKDDRFVPTSGLVEVTCYKGWATAGQEIDKNWWAKHGPVQPVTFVFRYDPNAGRWKVASAGTGGDCPTEMPDDVKKRLKYCA